MKILQNIICFLIITYTDAAFSDYVLSFLSFSQKNNEIATSQHLQKIPYEVSVEDEQFIKEASQLTEIALSELDSCQQRVVLKLKTECHKLNDEHVAKMAVALLNCQSYVEGRQIYPCSEEMSIKDCTSSMDSDTWTSYHLMSNRARAVCYSIRQMQFRGLAEHTVNRLMQTAQDQLISLNQIQHNQENIKSIAEDTYDALTKTHDNLYEQQADIRNAQAHAIEMLNENINKLYQEKKLVLETHHELAEMSRVIQNKLEEYMKQLNNQKSESKEGHIQLIKNILEIQKKAQTIFHKIDESSQMLIRQNENFKNLFDSTTKNLAEVNTTVHNLVKMMFGIRELLEQFNWVSKILEGTDLVVETLNIIIWHSIFILFAMLMCSFLSANIIIRLLITILPITNLILAIYSAPFSIEITFLIQIVTTLIILQIIITYFHNFFHFSKPNLSVTISNSLPINSEMPMPTPEEVDNISVKTNYSRSEKYEYENAFDRAFTPPLSRIGSYSRSNTPSTIVDRSFKNHCYAKTRLGTSCRLNRQPGKEYCHRHERGDSIIQ